MRLRTLLVSETQDRGGWTFISRLETTCTMFIHFEEVKHHSHYSFTQSHFVFLQATSSNFYWEKSTKVCLPRQHSRREPQSSEYVIRTTTTEIIFQYKVSVVLDFVSQSSLYFKFQCSDHPNYDPRTLFIPQSAFVYMTPFERQYWEIKRKHFDTILFFQKGKFYELFETDAEIGQSVLGLKMTTRVNMRMVGLPATHFNYWAAKLVALGYTFNSRFTTISFIRSSKNSIQFKSHWTKFQNPIFFTFLCTDFHFCVCFVCWIDTR